jgi:hypothetical protein
LRPMAGLCVLLLAVAIALLPTEALVIRSFASRRATTAPKRHYNQLHSVGKQLQLSSSTSLSSGSGSSSTGIGDLIVGVNKYSHDASLWWYVGPIAFVAVVLLLH